MHLFINIFTKTGGKSMKTNIIGPDSLEADAVVPQCLDNQYVSDKVFDFMVNNKKDYNDETVSLMREQEIQTEFIRSIVYSSQVVIQRAFLKNNSYLYKNYLPEEKENLEAFAKLVREKAIIPFLFKESSLMDNLEFDLDKKGDLATKTLLSEVDNDVLCVRLAADDTSNNDKTEDMAINFGAGITRLQHLREMRRNAMASELFASSDKLQEAGAWEDFNKSLNNLILYAFNKAPEKLLTRNDVYKDNFIIENGIENAVSLGLFRKPDRNNPFILELKKLVDLIYNTNLPDMLNRYTFTPLSLPSRIALQDNPVSNVMPKDIESIIANEEILTSIRRTFMAHSQKAMYLPLLKDLSIANVIEVRNLPEWTDFKDSQAAILKNPLRCLDLLEKFQYDFDMFQRSFSEWYNKKYERKNTEGQYFNYVSLALSIGGKLIVAGSNLGPIKKTLAGFAAEGITGYIPEKVKGYAVKLMVNIFDKGQNKLDKDRSYSIELMRSNEQLTKEDVEHVLNSVNRIDGIVMPAVREQLADQGKQ